MDIGTGLAIWGAAGLAKKILGPTADYIGEGVKNWTEKRNQNVRRIFENAIKKAGSKLEKDGAVPPKVLRGILNEGSFCEDQITAEYFGGILASSRSGIIRDDRGATYISLLSRLSTYQIRAHYVFYQIVKMVLDGQGLHFTIGEDCKKAEIFIPGPIFMGALEIKEEEIQNFDGILTHIMFGLGKEDLIGPLFSYGSRDKLRLSFASSSENGLIFQPSPLGVELFLWGHGQSDLDVNQFLNVENQFDVSQEVSIVHGSRITKV